MTKSCQPTRLSPTLLPPNTLRTAERRFPSLRCPAAKAVTCTDIRSRTTHQPISLPSRSISLGYSEMERIGNEMLAIAHQQGFSDVASFRRFASKRIRNISPPLPSRSWMTSADIWRRCRPSCRSFLRIFPASPVTVEAIPVLSVGRGHPLSDRQLRMGSARAGWSSPPQTSPTARLIDDEATAYHEGIPGHHMQLPSRSR